MAQTFVYNSGTYQETNFGTIHLEFGLFFDGTLNNKDNTDLRLKMLNQEDLKILPSDNVNTVTQKEELIKKRRERFENDELTNADKWHLGLDFKDIKTLEQTLEKEKQAGSEVPEILKEIVGYYNADKRSLADKQGVDNSLMNDYTNVARMWACCNETYAIYIEGIGTLNWQKDIDAGFQFGSGDTGIRGKVRRGCYELGMKIKEKLPEETDEVIKVTLDVFGFSRGAAAARNFLYEINISNKREEDTKLDKRFEKTGRRLYNEGNRYGYNEYAYFYYDKDNVRVNIDFFEEGKWPKYGYLGYYLLKEGINPKILDKISLEIRFVGIYDTVSSYEEFGNIKGISLKIKGIEQASYLKDYFKDDVKQLQLNNIGNFGKAVHFTAMDEHRENFSLTKLRPQESNCNYIEKAFPGVHCDIGGAYETGTEYVDEIDTSNHSNLHNLKKELIAEHWFKEKELEIGVDWHNVAFGVLLGWLTKSSLLGGATVYRKLSGTRLLRKEYSYIPLHFMEEFFDTTLKEDANKRITIIKKRITSEYSIENDPESILGKAKDRLRTYVFRDEKKAEKDRSEVEKEWRFISDEERKKLLQEEGRKVIDEIKSKRRKEQEKIKKEDQNMMLLEGGTHKKTVTFDSEPKINYAKVLQEVYKRNSIFETQDILKKLRNKYLHWSANRDWFGMDPTSDRKRKEY